MKGKYIQMHKKCSLASLSFPSHPEVRVIGNADAPDVRVNYAHAQGRGHAGH